MYLDYNRLKNEFTSEELRHLSEALGFPKYIFEKNIPEEYLKATDSITIQDLIKCIDERYFNVDLHYTVNLKSGAYNAACIRKAANFLSSRYLSYKGLQDVRLAFEAYEEYDQKGMKIDEYTFLRALKMCGRVISPKKLMHKIKYLKYSYDEPGRIQLYEFLDLLTLCERSEKYDVTYDLKSPVEKTWTKLYEIDNFRSFTTPKDKKLWKHLNDEYKERELSYNQPELKSHEFVVHPLKSEDFRTQVKLSNQKYEMLHRSLKSSNEQVQLAKGGFTFARPRSVVNGTTIKKARTFSASIGKFSPSTTPQVSAKPSTPKSPTTGTSPSVKTTVRRAQRPHSSPPVVNEGMMRDSKAKVENLQFDICTAGQRWSDYYFAEMSSHLPNYPEVLRRMRKLPATTKTKKKYRRERPCTATIEKLARHEPMPPAEHVEHCDALLQGIGSDKYSLRLKNKAKKIRSKSAPVISSTSRVKSASTATGSTKRRMRYSALLETLMAQYGYASESDSSQDENEEETKDIVTEEPELETHEAEVVLPESEVSSIGERSDEEDVSADDLPSKEADDEVNLLEKKEKFLEEYFKWKKEKIPNIEKFLNESGYYRTFIKPSEPSKTYHFPENVDKPDSQQTPRSSEKFTSGESEPLSEFEKQIRSTENYWIPHDVFLFEMVEDVRERKRKMRSLKRISKRFPEKDQKWFISMAYKQLRTPTPRVH